MRRISEALDGPGGIAGDADVSAWIAEDPAALAYAQDLVRIDEVLRELGRERAAQAEPDWDAMALRIEARLDDALPALAGVDDAPRFADEPAAPREEATRPSAGAKVVPLAPRRAKGPLYWLGGLAAAAAVGLGITFGLYSFQAEPAAESAAATLPATGWAERAAQSPAAPASAAVMAEAEAAEMPLAAPAPPPAPAPAAEPAPRAEPAAVAAAPSPTPRTESIAPARAAAGASPADARLDETLARPTRAEVISALQSVEPAVQRCLQARGEVARASVQVGADGTVISVRVDPPYVGGEARCIVDAVHGARLPRSPEDYQAIHTFRPAPIAGGSLSDRPMPAARARRAAPQPNAAREDGY